MAKESKDENEDEPYYLAENMEKEKKAKKRKQEQRKARVGEAAASLMASTGYIDPESSAHGILKSWS